ncbi:MAG: hypothetical protein LBQ77_00260 [Treponema sp.]|jgi:hypothetical protein|nr:hypothetical protein [Treponema sp.]
MKKLIAVIVTVIVAEMAFAAEVSFDDPNLSDIDRQNILDGARDGVTEALQNAVDDIFNTTFDTLKPGLDWLPNTNIQQNIQAESYIGQLFAKGSPPHLTFGETIGLGSDGILKDAGDTLGILLGSGGTLEGLPVVPLFTADLRLGGVFLPFDLGFSFVNYRNTVDMLKDPFKEAFDFNKVNTVHVDIRSFGIDVRYRILEDGVGLGLTVRKSPVPAAPKLSLAALKQPSFWRPFIPGLSVSAGYSRYDLGIGINGAVTVDGRTADVDADIGFQVQSVYGGLHISKKIFFIVPYMGLRVASSQSAVTARVNAATTVRLDSIDVLGNTYTGDTTITGTGSKEDSVETDGWKSATFFYWGVGFNMGILQISLGTSFNLSNDIAEAEGLNIGIRLKL